MRVGLISDTHDFLDPRVAGLFAGVAHILHAGDVGSAWITFQLEQIAPVTAVLGNTDTGMSLPLLTGLTLGGKKFLLQHIVTPFEPDDALRRRITRDRPDAVLFGHTHKAFDQVVDGVRFINPGYAGRPKFNQPRSVALLNLSPAGIVLESIPLAG